MRIQLFLPMLVLGCGPATPAVGEADTDTDTDTDSDSDTDTDTDAPLMLDDLVGDWIADCFDLGEGIYFGTSTFSFDGSNSTGTYAQWTNDPTCAGTPNLEAEIADGGWVLGQPSGPGVELDRTMNSFVYTLLDQATVDGWNTGSGCGPFTLDTPKDTVGLTCYGWATPASGATLYDLVQLDDHGALRFGDTLTGDRLSPATRPTGLYVQGPYLRQ